MTCRLGFAAAALLTIPLATQAASPTAEYAIRWDPAQGGSTAAQAWAKLGAPGAEADTFVVRYPSITAPPPLPAGFKAIVRKRERTNKARYELTYKQRGPAPSLDGTSLKHWPCPVGATKDRKDEVDVSFHSLSTTVRAHSRSCTVESKDAPPRAPEALAIRPAACEHQMTRWKRDGLALEEWSLKGGRTVIEVSASGGATDKELAAFRKDVVEVLVQQLGITPLEASMTELASRCGA
jgi:hypothetical protein